MIYYGLATDTDSVEEETTEEVSTVELATSTDAFIQHIDENINSMYMFIQFAFLIWLVFSCHKILHYIMDRHTKDI